MSKKILVPLKKHDRIEEIVPYLEEITQPGTNVVFLIRYPVNGFKWLQAYCGIMQCGLDNALMLRKMVESYSVKTRRQLARQKVFQTCQALHRLGVKRDRKSTRLNSSHQIISYAVFCLKKKKKMSNDNH